MKRLKIPTGVKCDQKVKERRTQIIEAAKELFFEKGFHKTTTREISKKANLSFGAIYEYVGSKEDILFLLIEQYYDKLEAFLCNITTVHPKGMMNFEVFIIDYFTVIDQLSNEINIIYRDVKSLPYTYIEFVQSRELEFLSFIKEIIKATFKAKNIGISDDFFVMITRNLIVQGQVWAFRKWDLSDKTTLEDYIEFQQLFFTNVIREHLNCIKVKYDTTLQ